MLDIKFIRENIEAVRQALKNKNHCFDLDNFLRLDAKRRELTKEADELRAAQNKISEEVGRLLKDKKDAQEKIAESKNINQKISTIDNELKIIKNDFETQLLNIPNIPHPSIPVGGPENNKIVKTQGKIREFDFKPLDHIQIAEKLDIVDFKRGTKISGSNFLLFKGSGARLERALINFMLDLHTKEHGYKEISPAFLVNRASMTCTGQLPKLEEDMYRLKDDDLFLIPTAEVPVTNIHRDEIIEESQLPVYYAAYSACFRREAGSYGKDTRGMMRVHQFDKVELVKFVRPETSYDELEKLLVNACRVLELLEIPYRILILASGDISFAAAKCYDIEIYAPGLNKWLEVSSCSNFEDFQARRGNIRFREKETGKTKFVHTLNGSGTALARLVVAILENYQEADGTVTVPQALRRYLNGDQKL
jgi:seryl-tRNA synthetase